MVKKVGPAGSLGPRYGTVARKRYAEIISVLRAKHECPRCQIRAVRRVSVGVWYCRKCGYKFAGGAYQPTTKLGEIARRATKGEAPVTGLVELLEEEKEERPTRRARTRRRETKQEPEASKSSESESAHAA